MGQKIKTKKQNDKNGKEHFSFNSTLNHQINPLEPLKRRSSFMLNLIRMVRSSSSVISTAKCAKLDQCDLSNRINHGLKRGISNTANTTATTTDTTNKKPKIDSLSPLKTGLSIPISNIINNTSNSQEDLRFPYPRALPGVGAPAKHQQRTKYITALVNAYRSHNIALPKRKAVDEEYNVAVKSSNITYGANMTSLLKKARANIDTGLEDGVQNKKKHNKLSEMNTQEIYDAVRALIHPKAKLERNSYIVDVPVVANADEFDIKTCNRCSNTFNINDILKDTKCQFHERKKRYDTTGKYWECCSEVVGDSQGCKTCNYHVFKATTPHELQSLIPFKHSPKPLLSPTDIIESKKRIVGLDCEMGFTTKGLELIRLTVMDFYTGKVLFDETIKPVGKVLDLNTTWSGVSEIPHDSLSLDELHEVIFHTIIDEETIIVGHGLENDLNCLRLVHHNVVDTAILFPKGLDKKYALKDLAFQILDRKIQTGEHNSEEDSLAAIDIIKNYISK